MTDEKPLHVRVAEALGWFGFEPSLNGLWPEEWRGKPPTPIVGEPSQLVPRYDTDWSAAGPLIERFGITMGPLPKEEDRQAGPFVAWVGYDYCDRRKASGATPLLAVCNLILALAEAGKLPREEQ